MKHFKFCLIFYGTLLVFFNINCYANIDTKAVEEIYIDVQDAWQEQDWQLAIDLLEKLKSQGYQSNKLNYNLALSYHQSGDYSRSVELLQNLSTLPAFALPANYYSALSYLALEQSEKAQILFENLANQTEQPWRDRAEEQLDRMVIAEFEDQSSDEMDQINRLTSLLSLSVSQIDGFIDPRSSDIVPVSDTTTELLGSLSWLFWGDYHNGLSLTGNVFLSDYSEYSEYDFALFSPLIKWRKRVDNWLVQPAVKWSKLWLENEPYLQKTTIQFDVKYYKAFHKPYLRIEFNNIQSSSSTYNAHQGNSSKIRLGYTYSKRFQWDNRYTYILTDKSGEQTEYADTTTTDEVIGYFSNYDKTSQEIESSVNIDYNHQWEHLFLISYNRQEYKPNITTYDDQSTTEFKKWINRLRLKTSLTYAVNQHWELALIYQYDDSQSNSENSEHQSNTFTLQIDYY